MRGLILLVAIGLAMGGCQHDPYADKYLCVEPTEGNVVGIYMFDYQTVDYGFDKEKAEEYKSTIIINSNHTFRIDNLPYFKEFETMNYRFEKRISLAGTWTIEKIGAVDSGNGDLKSRWGLKLESAPKELKYAGLIGAENPNGMIFGFGDPDSGNVMILSKK